jgi:hypothetical protein
VWLETALASHLTQILIRIGHPELEEEVRANFGQWVASPIPLLFFRKLKRLEVQGTTITRQRLRPGPVKHSEWVRVSSGRGSQELLRIASPEVALPPDALAEVRSERGDTDFELPPCRVEIVVGQDKQRVYVVLPTEVRPPLPFSANAPFIQDPARTGLKELSLSATNRWLLDRVGRLAAQAMLEWLTSTSLDLVERAQAYSLLPAAIAGNGGMDQDCAEMVAKAFVHEIAGQPVLLTSSGELARRIECLGLPAELLEVWSPKLALGVFGKGETSVIASEVSEKTRATLSARNWLSVLRPEHLIETLCQPPRPPRPDSLDGVARLWRYIENKLPSDFWWGPRQRQLRIVPVRGKQELAQVDDVLVLGERDGHLTPEDWDFLVAHVDMVDPEWVERVARPSDGPRLASDLEVAYEVAGRLFRRLRLDRRVGLQQIVEAVTKLMFTVPGSNRQASIQLAQVAARGGIAVSGTFHFLCRDGQWRRTVEGLLIELKSEIESLLPTAWVTKHLLHADYSARFGPNDWEIWRHWSLANDLGLFPLPAQVRTLANGYEQASAAAREHGFQGTLTFPRKRLRFELEDYDFDGPLWAHWERKARHEPDTWGQVMRGILQASSSGWRQRSRAQLRQLSGQSTYMVAENQLLAKWVVRLRDLPCLPDTRGNWRLPSQLMRTTPDTAPLQNIESFVRADYDRQETQWLLDLLGVRSTPDSADRLLARLRALAQPDALPPRLYVELIDLYRALDRVLPRLETNELAEVRQVFAEERLIRAEDESWQSASGIFQRNDDEIPGVVLVLGPAADLTLWDRVGVPSHPTLEMVLDWLQALPPGQRLGEADRKRARQMLGRLPRQAWQRGGWLDLSGRWALVSELRYYTLNASVERGLFAAMRQATADFSVLPDEEADWVLSTGLLSLEGSLQQKLQKAEAAGSQKRPEWLAELARCLLLVKPALAQGDNAAVATWQANRDLARRLGRSQWRPVRRLEVMPYVEGTPAGEARPVKAAWVDEVIYVLASGPSHHRELAGALASPFRGQGLAQAIADCIDRPPRWVADYFAANFELIESETAVGPEPEQPEVLTEPAAPVRENGSLLTGPSSEAQDNRVVPDAAAQPATDEAPAPGENRQSAQGELSTPSEESNREPREQSAETAEPAVEAEAADGRDRPARANARGRFERLRSFMQRIGFQWDAARGLFADVRGNVVRREEDVLEWVIYDRNGQRRDGYWMGDRTLEQGLEMPAGDWETLKRTPENAWLLLPDDAGELRALQMKRLLARLQSGEVGLYPALFRLRLESAREMERDG